MLIGKAETWWVNGLVRHPVLIPYTLGSKRLDKIYLDTTFAIKSDVYRSFPSKAEGLRELLEKVHAYPEDTIFYLRAWTFGYEDVWLALATALDSKVCFSPLYSNLANFIRSTSTDTKEDYISHFIHKIGRSLKQHFSAGLIWETIPPPDV